MWKTEGLRQLELKVQAVSRFSLFSNPLHGLAIRVGLKEAVDSQHARSAVHNLHAVTRKEPNKTR